MTTSSTPSTTTSTACNVVLDIECDDSTTTADTDSASSSASSSQGSSPNPIRSWLDGAAARWSFSRSTSTQSEKEPPMPSYDVFLGGSCGNTVWRRELVIPYLKKRSITYYDPQRPAWNENMIHEEQIAKEVILVNFKIKMTLNCLELKTLPFCLGSGYNQRHFIHWNCLFCCQKSSKIGGCLFGSPRMVRQSTSHGFAGQDTNSKFGWSNPQKTLRSNANFNKRNSPKKNH